VDGGEHEVAGECRLHGNLRGLLVTDLTHEDHIGILPEHRAENARKGEAGRVVDGRLGDVLEAIFDGVFDREDVAGKRVDLTEGCVERGGFS
jgi:hypothetical protein